MIFEIGQKIYLKGLRPKTGLEVMKKLTLPNPKYEEAVKQGRWLGGLEPKLYFYEAGEQGFVCPRGAARQLYCLCKKHGEQITLVDNRRTLPLVDFAFHGTLRAFQQKPTSDCLGHDFGLLSAPTGSGKTVMACYLIAERRQPTLIVVHTRELLNQWQDRIRAFLGVAAGIIGSGKHEILPVTVATIQSLVKYAPEVAPHFGYLILDECHRAPAMQYVKTIEHFDCRYMTGLSATPFRRDGLSEVIFWHIGDVAGQLDKADLLKDGDLCPADILWIETGFSTSTDASEYYSRALSELTEDEPRNRLICQTMAENNGDGISLILSDRKAHCHALAEILEIEHDIEAAILTGSTGKREREQILDDLNQGRCRYLVATSQLIGEGFDLPEISSMFLTTPVKYHGRLIQYIGRALRPAPGKARALIYDFVDIKNPIFRAQAKSRERTYTRQLLGVAREAA